MVLKHRLYFRSITWPFMVQKKTVFSYAFGHFRRAISQLHMGPFVHTRPRLLSVTMAKPKIPKYLEKVSVFDKRLCKNVPKNSVESRECLVLDVSFCLNLPVMAVLRTAMAKRQLWQPGAPMGEFRGY